MNTNKTQAEQLPQVAVMQSVLKASDLRIGNKLLFLGDVVTFKNITEFREDGIFWIKTFEPKIESKNFHFKPIPLTEEWLLKLGFTKLDGCFGFETQRGNLIIEEDLCEITGDYNDIGFNSPCKYVHQLQNLYFALTGSELTVA